MSDGDAIARRLRELEVARRQVRACTPVNVTLSFASQVMTVLAPTCIAARHETNWLRSRSIAATLDTSAYAWGVVNLVCSSSGGSVIKVPPFPSLEITKVEAMAPNSARLAVCVPSLTVRFIPVLVLFSV